MRLSILSAAVGFVGTLACSALSFAAPAVLAPTSDGFVYQSLGTVSAAELAAFSPGMNSSLGVGITGGAAPREILSLMKFDLTGVSFNPATEKATITLTNIGTSFIVPPASNVTNPTPAQPVTVGVKPVTSPWNFATVSYSPGPSFFPPNQVNAGQPTYGAAIAETKVVSGVGQVVTFDLSALVQGWLAAPATNNGIALFQTSAPDFITGQGYVVANFSSSRGPNPSSLTIAPIPEPATLASLALAGIALLARRRVSR